MDGLRGDHPPAAWQQADDSVYGMLASSSTPLLHYRSFSAFPLVRPSHPSGHPTDSLQPIMMENSNSRRGFFSKKAVYSGKIHYILTFQADFKKI
jgi:hypothetical protein